jgi:hypothetical protein
MSDHMDMAGRVMAHAFHDELEKMAAVADDAAGGVWNAIKGYAKAGDDKVQSLGDAALSPGRKYLHKRKLDAATKANTGGSRISPEYLKAADGSEYGPDAASSTAKRLAGYGIVGGVPLTGAAALGTGVALKRRSNRRNHR